MTASRVLRLARAEECTGLSALALRSKAHWGYDDAFVQACRTGLAVDPEAARAGRVVVLVEADTPLGFYALAPGERPGETELSLLFVEPAAIGHGIGRALWEHAVAKARADGAKRLKIESDPFAVSFYHAVGATLTGEVRAGVRATDGSERQLPVLQFDL